MITTYSILFYIKDERRDKNGMAALYVRITVNGKRATMSLHRKIDPVKWDSHLNKLKGKGVEAEEVSDLMTNVRHKLNKIQNQLIDKGEPFSAIDIKNLFLGKKEKPIMVLEVFDEHNRQMKKLVDIEFALGTYKRYFTTRDHIYNYAKEEYRKEDILIRDVNLKFIKGFEYFLKEKRNCNHNSALKYVNNFKKIIRIAVGNGWITNDPFYNYKVNFKTTDREFLTKEELQSLINCEIHWDRLEIVRDMFVFCCYTGLAYVDIQKLNDNNIVTDIEGNLCIQAKRTKTKTNLTIPLLPPAIAVLDRYKNHPKVINGDCVLPVLSNQKSNAYLKEIAVLSGIRKNLTTHLARHTFATTVTLTNGVPLETVGKMLGHKNLRTTQHYAKIVDRKINNDMMILQKKLADEEKNNDEKKISKLNP